MADELIAAIPKNSREEVRVMLDRFNGRDIFNARVFWQDSDLSRKPGKQGLAFKIEMLPAFAEAVTKALEEARKRGLL